MTYKQRLDFLFEGEPDIYDLINNLAYHELLNNPNRHNKRIVMKLCVLKLKEDYNAISSHSLKEWNWFGAIWTDKGLIYKAKMKGVLPNGEIDWVLL